VQHRLDPNLADVHARERQRGGERLAGRPQVVVFGREDVDKCSRPGFPGFEVVRA
jgi:hypothetical protein